MLQCPAGPACRNSATDAGTGCGNSAALAPDPYQAPFLHVRWRNGRAECRGTQSHFEGFRLRDPSRGVFASWNWDGRTLDVDCGWGGFRPLFYAASADEIRVSPSIPVLLREGAPADLDYPALCVLAGWNYVVGDRTVFRAVRAVPRSGRLRWSPGRLEAEDRIPPVNSAALSRDGFVDAIIEAVRASIRRCEEANPDGPWLVPLSTGRDSRFLLLELLRQGAGPITCLTTDQVDVFAGEGPVAAELARRCGVEHRIVQRAAPSAGAWLETLRLTQLHAPEHVWLLNLAAELGKRPGVVLDGIGTDSLMKPSGLLSPALRKRYGEGKLEEVVEEMRLIDPWIAVRRPARRDEWECEGRQLLIDELRRHAGAPNPTGSFRFWNRARRTVGWSPFGLLGMSNPVLTPYLDQDVVSLAYAMPADTLLESDLRTTAIHRAFPEYSDIPFECTSGAPRERYSWSVRARMAADVMLRVAAAPPSDLLDNAWLWPRLARSVADPGYSALAWFLVPALRALMIGSWMQRRFDGLWPYKGDGEPA